MRRMIVPLVVALIVAAAPCVSDAQGLSLKGGLSYGRIPNNSGVLPGRLSAHSGVALGAGLSTGEVFGIGVEGLYAQRGFESSALGASQELSYVDVPAYVRFAMPIPAFGPFVYAGPQMSFELNCDSGGGGSCPSGRPKTTYAGVIGGGVRFGMLTFEGRYVYGLTDLKLSTVSNSENYRTRSFMILAGVGF